jgi:hypothetical protein
MTALATARVCRPAMRPKRSERHWNHWEWLSYLPLPRYRRALRLWKRLHGVRPRGLVVNGEIVRVLLERG